jgi:hypothetical protein
LRIEARAQAVSMSARNPDGSFRNHNEPMALSEETLLSRWVEGEVLRLKLLGFSFGAIAEQITEVGRGKKAPLTPLPEAFIFPSDYKITAMGCHKAFRGALERSPAPEADEMRRLDTDRCEDMFLFLGAAIRRGEPQAVRAAVQVLAHKAAINRYNAPEVEVKVSPPPRPRAPELSDGEVVSLFERAIAILKECEEAGANRRLKTLAIEVQGTKRENENK